jgi:hypothetical protein
MFTSLAIAQSSLPADTSDQGVFPAAGAAIHSAALPPPPGGRSTVIGGRILEVDPVLDRFTLKVFGGRTLRILFDERTEVYRNGLRIPVLDLRPDDHASIETTLDGTNIFALKIHTLSQFPQGECRGQVLSYNQRTGVLTVSTTLSREPITLRVPPGTPVRPVDQVESSSTVPRGSSGLLRGSLVHGSLVDVKFEPGVAGQGVATQVDILATTGSAFVFSGQLSFLDSHSGRLVIADPRDDQSYEIFFHPSQFPASRQLREGTHVRVTATFDGSRYVATNMAIE